MANRSSNPRQWMARRGVPLLAETKRKPSAWNALRFGGIKFEIAKWREEKEEEQRRKAADLRFKLQSQKYSDLERLRKERLESINPTGNPNAPTLLYKQRAAEVKEELQRRTFGRGLGAGVIGPTAMPSPLTNEELQAQANDPLIEYQRLARSWGADKVGERMADIKGMWDAYGSGYDGSEVVWELTRSSFTLPEIKNMLDEANYVLSDMGEARTLALRQEVVAEKEVLLRNKYKLQPRQWNALEKVFKAQEDAEMPTGWSQDKLGTILMLSLFLPIPGLQFVGAFGKTLAQVATKTAQVAKFGGKFTAGMAAITGLAEIDEAGRLNAIADKEEAANKALDLQGRPIGQILSQLQDIELERPFQDVRDLRAALANFNQPENRDDIIALQEEWHALGIGEDLPASGVLDYEWQGEIVDAAQEMTRVVFEEQRVAVEEGDADYWAEINGDMDDPYWQDVFARREERLAQQDAARVANYDKFMWYERSGLPRNSLEAKALGRRLARNGWLQAAYGGLLQVALTVGQTVDATASAINLNIRQGKDPEYQRRVNALISYVNAQDFQPDDNWTRKPVNANEGFARAQIEHPDGALAGDETAQALMAAVNERQAQLINEDYDADILESMGLLFGSSPERMKQIERDHPDIVRAFTTGVYIATARANPIGRTYRAAFKPTIHARSVEATTGAFLESWRAKRIVGSLAKYYMDNDAGRAVSFARGTGAQVVLNKLWRLTGKKADRLDPKSQIVVDLAKEVVDAVDAGTPHRVAEILRDAPDEVVDFIVQKAMRPHPTLTRQQAIGAVGSVAERALAEKRVADTIARRQTKYGDVVTEGVLSRRLHERLAFEYAKGADIFPYLRDNKINPPNRVFTALSKRVSEIKNPWLRTFMTKWTVGQLTRAPTAELEFRDLNTLDRVYDAAMLISQDAGWAFNFRNRWAGATNYTQLVKLANELELKFNSKFQSSRPAQKLEFRRRAAQAMGAEFEPGGQALAPQPSPINFADIEGSRLLTEKTVGKETIQALPDTVYQQYLFSLHRSALWAPYRLYKGKTMDAYLRNSMIVPKNIYRLFLGSAHRVSTPLRQWTVAMGAPLLFQKHAITDTFRTYMEEGSFSLLEAFGLRGLSVRGHTLVPQIRSAHARRLEDILGQVSPSLRDEILYSKARVHASEAQWLSGTNRHTYRPKTIRDKDGNIVDLDGSANALRRILEGKAFQQYSVGGPAAVRAWLDTKEGIAFLREGGWYKRARLILKESDKTVTPAQLKQMIRDDYMESIVRQEFDRLDTALPNIMPTLKAMARNEQVWSVNAIKKLIEDNPTDNAVLSMPAHEWAGGTQFPAAGWFVGKAMAANKWNRDVLYDHIFIKQYNRLTKEGIEATDAARCASTIAELNTSRVHFDLSNALAIEARHRWLAWFATKHRLYGTYMMKLAIERPTIAAAAVEIKNWMEERNEKKGVGDFDKYDLVIDRADGSQYRFNLAPYMWFSEFPLESSLALAMERGAEFVGETLTGHEAPGWAKPSPAPFGITATRADALIIGLWDAAVSSQNVKTEEDLSAWLNALPESRRLRWRRLINNYRAQSIARGENWTALQAFNEARMSNITDLTWGTFKFYSGKKVGAEELEIERLLKEYITLAQTDEEAARKLMQENPELAAAFNATMDPVEKEQLDEGFRLFNQAKVEYQRKLDSAYANGTLVNDYKDLAEDFGNAIDLITNPIYAGGENSLYNPVFAARFGSHDPQEFLKSLGMLMPLIPPESVWNAGKAKTAAQKDEYKETLRPAFLQVLAHYNMRPSDSSALLYQMFQEEMIETPLTEWSGETQYQLIPYTAQNTAQYLARGGEAGPFRADEFLDLVRDRTFQQWMSKGIGSTGKSTQPFMAFLTDEQVDLIGWNRAPAVRDAWKQYALMDWALKLWRAENVQDEEGKGISSSSTLYKETYRANMDPLVEKLKASVPGFAEEYEFSKLRMHERLLALGVGTGSDRASQGMSAFLSICTDYWEELDNMDNPSSKLPGVGPTAQVARPVWEKYVRQVAELKDDNPEWWEIFKGTYSISKFGFATTWRDTVPEVKELYWGTEDMPAVDYTEEAWYE